MTDWDTILELIVCCLYFISIVFFILKIAHLTNISWLLVSTPAIISTVILLIVIGAFIYIMRNMR